MSAPAGSTAAYTVEVHDELMSLTLRMVGEYPEFPAGSVMRCVARAVRHARMPAHLASGSRSWPSTRPAKP